MLPEKYLDKMKGLLKDEFDDYLNSFNEKANKGLRINTTKISVADFIGSFPFKLEPIPWTDDGFYYEDDSITKHPFYHAGLFYIQEPSAMIPGEVLPIEEGDIVLDACAAPGGKSLKILNKLNDTGCLISNDISQSRAKALLRNIERQGYRNYFVTACDMKDLKKKYPSFFDRIILDAPCSGEGMFRKDPSLIKAWEERGNEYYSEIQKELIVSAVHMLKDGGTLVYSTCTFDESEDEDIISYAMERFPELSLLPLKMYEGFRHGKKDIGIKLFPHLVKGEGHFVCVIQKGKTNKKPYIKKEAIYPDISFDFLPKDLHDGSFKNIDGRIYFVPEIDTEGIRVLRSGLLIGEMKKDRSKPSQALAMSLKINEHDKVIELDEDKAIRYLKGETLRVNSDLEGITLIAFDGQPLGFGKIDKGLIKNLIDKGWIIR